MSYFVQPTVPRMIKFTLISDTQKILTLEKTEPRFLLLIIVQTLSLFVSLVC